MIVEQMLKNAPNPLLHIADVSGSALFQGDCLDIMPLIPDNSIDCIITDPPYGTTACKWDSVIPFDKMWKQLNRIIKTNGAIVLFGSEPFSSALRMSNIKNYKYDWIWDKKLGGNSMLVKYQPYKIHELIHVFSSKGKANYNPLMETRGEVRIKNGKTKNEDNAFGVDGAEYIKNNIYYPKSILEISNAKRTGRVHPTQKPVELMEYLIKTYTNENEMVLDFSMGSGSTLVASKNLNRKFIGIEKEANYYEIACQRCGF